MEQQDLEQQEPGKSRSWGAAGDREEQELEEQQELEVQQETEASWSWRSSRSH